MTNKFAWALLLLLTASGQVLGEGTDASHPASDARLVYIENLSGSVTVRGWDRDEVRVTGDLGDATHIEAEHLDDRLVLRAIYPDSWFDRILSASWFSRRGAELEFFVPREKALVVNVVSAHVRVTGIRGAQRQASVSGDIDLYDVAGAVRATASSGNVRVRGRLSGSAAFETSSGDIDLRAEVANGTELIASTASGNVRVLVDGAVTGEYVVSTASGEIHSCFGSERGRTQRGRLWFVDGSTDTILRVSTASGDVELCRS